jgi:uncharacterized protein (TIGR02246 family)
LTDGTSVLTELQLRSWLDAYGAAWETRDPDAAADLFADDVEYYETPFGQPARGREGVRAYWAGATGNQRDVSFAHDILAVTGNRGLARWRVEFTRVSSGTTVRLDGVFLLEFGDDGRCRSLREWWHRSEGDERRP